MPKTYQNHSKTIKNPIFRRYFYRFSWKFHKSTHLGSTPAVVEIFFLKNFFFWNFFQNSQNSKLSRSLNFQVAGTRDGFTAAQLDVKNDGLTRRQLTESLQAARAGIDHVLQKMSVMRDRPREQFKPTVPIIQSMRIEPHKRVTLFRNNGYNCKLIEAETGVKVAEILAENSQNILKIDIPQS